MSNQMKDHQKRLERFSRACCVHCNIRSLCIGVFYGMFTKANFYDILVYAIKHMNNNSNTVYSVNVITMHFSKTSVILCNRFTKFSFFLM